MKYVKCNGGSGEREERKSGRGGEHDHCLASH